MWRYISDSASSSYLVRNAGTAPSEEFDCHVFYSVSLIVILVIMTAEVVPNCSALDLIQMYFFKCLSWRVDQKDACVSYLLKRSLLRSSQNRFSV